MMKSMIAGNLFDKRSGSSDETTLVSPRSQLVDDKLTGLIKLFGLKRKRTIADNAAVRAMLEDMFATKKRNWGGNDQSTAGKWAKRHEGEGDKWAKRGENDQRQIMYDEMLKDIDERLTPANDSYKRVVV